MARFSIPKSRCCWGYRASQVEPLGQDFVAMGEAMRVVLDHDLPPTTPSVDRGVVIRSAHVLNTAGQHPTDGVGRFTWYESGQTGIPHPSVVPVGAATVVLIVSSDVLGQLCQMERS